MVQLDPEDVIPTPQEQINWNELTQSETDEFDQMLRDMTLIPSSLWDQAALAVHAVPADEGDSQIATTAEQERNEKGEEDGVEEKRGNEAKEKGEEEGEERKEEREETPGTPRTDKELLALPFKELTLTEFERVERIFLEQAAAADVVAAEATAATAAEAAKAASEAEAAAEIERKSNKEKELELLKIPFSKLSLTQFEDVEKLFLNGGVPAEFIPPIPTCRAPVKKLEQAEVTNAKEVFLGLPLDRLSVSDLEEVQSSFSDVKMPVATILKIEEQSERYVIH